MKTDRINCILLISNLYYYRLYSVTVETVSISSVFTLLSVIFGVTVETVSFRAVFILLSVIFSYSGNGLLSVIFSYSGNGLVQGSVGGS